MKSLLLFLSLCALAPASIGATRLNRNDVTPYFDFASNNPSDGNKVLVESADLLEKILGSNISEAERTYLNTKNYSLAYTRPASFSDQINYAVYNGNIYVEEKSYSYKVGGSAYVWTPELVVDGTSYPFNINNGHDSKIAKAPYGTNSNAEIRYKLSLSLNKTKVNTILNSAYSKAVENFDVQSTYNAELAKYNKYVADLNQYYIDIAKYYSDLDEYNTYQKYNNNLIAYQNDLAAYNTYLAQKAQYDIDAPKYEQYLVDKTYYDANWEANLAEYNAYAEAKAQVDYYMAALNILWTDFTYGDITRNVYGMIMGDSVTAALVGNKSEITSQAPGSDVYIKYADTSTQYLRNEFLPKYNAFKKDEDRYFYFKSNYTLIKRNSENLLRCLDKLFRFGIVREAINAKGKIPQYTLLVAELAYFCNAIDNIPIYNAEGYDMATNTIQSGRAGALVINKDWTFRDKTYTQWLGGNLLDTSRAGAPRIKVYPTPVELLVEPEEVPEPIMPEEVAKPTPPAVPNPFPTVSTEPTKPIEPTPVAQPVAPQFDNLDSSLINAYLNHDIAERANYTDNVPVTFVETVDLSQVVAKNIAIFHAKEYGESGQSVLYYSYFNNGATFVGSLPYKPGDGVDVLSYTCVWADSVGQETNLASLSESIELYPLFKPNEFAMYRVEFDLGDGRLFYKYYMYDEVINENDIPTPTHADDDEHYYEFSSWDRPFENVKADTKYYAQFNELTFLSVTFYRRDGELWKPFEKQSFQYKPNDYVKKPELSPDDTFGKDGHKYVFKGWNYDFSYPIKNDVKIYGIYDEYYKIQFVTNTNTYEKWVLKGDTPTLNSDWTVDNKPSTYEKYYTFENTWIHDDQTVDSFAKATSNTAYYANYIEHDTVYSDSGVVSLENKTDSLEINYFSESNNVSVNVSHLMDTIKQNVAKPLTFLTNGDSVAFDKHEIELLANSNFAVFEFDKSSSGEDFVFETTLKDSNGQKIDKSTISPTVTINNIPELDHYTLFDENGKEVSVIKEGNSITFDAKLNCKYALRKFYFITKQFTAGVNGFTINKTKAFPGESINIDYSLTTGFELKNAYYQNIYGQKTTISSKSFTMPNEDVTVFVNASRINCEYIFMVEGNVYAKVSGQYGTIISLPDDPIKYDDENYQYTFAGWGKEVDQVIKEDMVFNAEFNQIPYEFDDETDTGPGKYSVIMGVSILSVSLGGLGVGAFFLIKFLLKKKTI